ncbi:MAG: hypothetical protein QF363_05030, partial [Planctomycetaceae bacterium]|nr:hypothetical protein [Planctomycetaceae bacterium]
MIDAPRRISNPTTALSLAVIVVALVMWWLLVRPVPSVASIDDGRPNKALLRGRADPAWQREIVLPGQWSWITNVRIIDLDD